MSSPRRENGDALRCGDRSAAVTEIRAALSALGLLGDADEDLTTGRHVALELFDSELDQAVRAFQQHRGLLVDGIVGEATYRALKEASYRLGARTLFHQFWARFRKLSGSGLPGDKHFLRQGYELTRPQIDAPPQLPAPAPWSSPRQCRLHRYATELLSARVIQQNTDEGHHRTRRSAT